MDRVANLPLKIPTPWASGAKTGFVHPVPNASQIGAVNGAASFVDGFVPLNFTPVSAGGIPPSGADLNGVIKQITEWDRWFQAGGPVRLDPLFQSQIGGYPAEARIGSNVTPYLVWQSTANNNMSNPDTGGGGWQTPVFPDVSASGKGIVPGLTVTAAAPATNTSLGAQIAFAGNTIQADGRTTVLGPKKWLRVYNGTFALINDAYTAEIFSVDNTGNITNVHDITAGGAISASSLTSHGDATINLGVQAGTLTVYGAASTGNLTVNGSAIVHGAATIDGTVTAASVSAGSITVGPIHGTSNVQIDGSIIANGNITALGALVGLWIHSTGSAQIDVNLVVNGSITTAYIHDTGSAQIDGNVQVNGSLNANFDLTAQRNIAAAGTITGGYINSTGNINATSAFTGGAVAVSGNVTCASAGVSLDLTVGRNADVAGQLAAGDLFSRGPVYIGNL
jgi:cytoskeletal protein CcmA (bactofilin family)